MADDTAAIQAAIDKAAGSVSGGIVFVPSGRYRMTRTVYVWRAVRVIGYGATRPVFALAENTPGYQKGIGLMVMFSAARHVRLGHHDPWVCLRALGRASPLHRDQARSG